MPPNNSEVMRQLGETTGELKGIRQQLQTICGRGGLFDKVNQLSQELAIQKKHCDDIQEAKASTVKALKEKNQVDIDTENRSWETWKRRGKVASWILGTVFFLAQSFLVIRIYLTSPEKIQVNEKMILKIAEKITKITKP